MNPRESWYTERREDLNRLDAEIKKLIQDPLFVRPMVNNYHHNLNFILRKMVVEIKTNNDILELLSDWMRRMDNEITMLKGKTQLKGLEVKKIEEDVETVKTDIKKRINPFLELIEEAKKRREKWMEENR